MFVDWTKKQWQDFGLGCLWVITSFAFFRTLQFVVRWYLFGKCTFRTFSYFGLRGRSRNNDSRELTVIPPNKKWRISNEAVSLFHSVVSGLWASYALLFYKGLVDDMINERCQVALDLIFLSGGYLLHDLIDLLVNEQSARIIELLFHHVIVLTGFSVTLITGKYLGVVIYGLLMELNSVFLHSRSLLNLYGVNKKSTSFRLIALLNIVTLAIFRLAVSIFLFYWLVSNIASMVWYHSVITTLVIVSLCITNTVLSYRVMAADGLFGASRARKPIAQTTSTVVDVEEQDDEEDEESPHEVAVQTTGPSDTRVLVDDNTQTVA